MNTEQFIEKARKIHIHDDYDYSCVNYVNGRIKVTIICKVHGKFQMTPQSHLYNKCGCNLCGIETIRKKNTLPLNEIIEKFNKIHNNRYDYSKVEYINSKTPVTIICKMHGEFQMEPDRHIHSKQGCIFCYNESRGKSTLTLDEFIEKSNETHPNNTYDYSKVQIIVRHKPVTIICKMHGEFQQIIWIHMAGGICKFCRKKVIADKNRITREKFINRVIQKWGDIFDFSKMNYVDVNTPVTIICKFHGEFVQKPVAFRESIGCNQCSREACMQKWRSSQKEIFIERAKCAHKNDPYDYTSLEYIDSNSPVTIICKIHGKFTIQTASYHLHKLGYGRCPSCLDEIRSVITKENSIKMKENLIDQLKVIFADKNYNYDLIEYVNRMVAVKIVCPTHGIFLKTPDGLRRGTGCSKCLMCQNCLMFEKSPTREICIYCEQINKLFNIKQKRQKTKELETVKYLKENLPNHEFIHNRSIGTDCTDGHLYPDIRFEFDTYHLIVEIDEHQHRGASYECDKQRMYDIIAKLGQPCMFIRYNPDNKKSDKKVLLDTVKQYLDREYDDVRDIFDDYGFASIYLYYENKQITESPIDDSQSDDLSNEKREQVKPVKHKKIIVKKKSKSKNSHNDVTS